MRRLTASGGSDTIDLSSEVQIPLNGTTAFYNNNAGIEMRIRISVKFTGIVIGSTLTWKVQLGAGNSTSKVLPQADMFGTLVTQNTSTYWQSPEIMLGRGGSDWDYLKVSFESDNGADSSIPCTTEIYVIGAADDNGRVNVGLMLDQAVTLTNNRIDVNTEEVLGGPPMASAGILAQLLAALDTAIPGSPTASSINALIQFAFNVAECDWYLDTGQSPYEMVYHAKGDTGTEYVRKKLYEVDGTPVTTLAQLAVIGKHVEP